MKNQLWRTTFISTWSTSIFTSSPCTSLLWRWLPSFSLMYQLLLASDSLTSLSPHRILERKGLCDPIDGSTPGSPVPGILQARTLEWATMTFSYAWKWKRKGKLLSMFYSSRPHGLQPTRLLHPWDFPGKRTRVDCHCLLHIITLVFSTVRLLISFKNFSFAFTTWLTVWHNRYTIWTIFAFGIPFSLSLIISSLTLIN